MRDIAAILFILISFGLFACLSVMFADRVVAIFFYHYFPPVWKIWFELPAMIFTPRLMLVAGVAMLLASFFILNPAVKGALRFAGTNVSVSLLATLCIKIITCRPRPEYFLAHDTYDFGLFCLSSDLHSFPSGHAVASTSFVLSVMMLFKKSWLNVAGIFVIAYIAVSRMVITEHYLTDVMAGVVLGGLICFLNYRLFSPQLKPFRNGT